MFFRSAASWRSCTSLLAICVAAPASAQTTGTLRVEVVDEDQGLPVPRAEVVLSGDGLIGGDRSCTADLDGGCVFSELLPGQYALEVHREGFRGVSVRELTVSVRDNHHEVAMQPGNGGAEEVVFATPDPVDPRDTVIGERYSRELIERLPTGQSISRLIAMTPGIDGGFNPSGAGSSFDENTVLLDGMVITDPVTGTVSRNFNIGALQSLDVMLGGVEPEYGVSLGATTNMVTRSGSNNLELDVSGFVANGNWGPRMDARWAADGRRLAPSGFDQTYRDLNIGTALSGPLVKDKVFFLISTQHARSLISVNSTPQPRDYDGHYLLGKITAQPTSAHRLTTLVQLDPTTIDNQNQGSPFVLPEAQQRQSQGGFVAQGRWQWLPDHTRALDTQFVVQKQYLEVGATPCQHSPDPHAHRCKPTEEDGSLDWSTPGRTGLNGAMDSVNWGTYTFDDRWRVTASSKFSVLEVKDPFLGGTHDFKVGVEATQTIWDQLQGISGNSLYTDIQQVQGDPRSFANYYWIETTGPISFRTTGSETSFFLQDAWSIRPNLTLKYGTRMDRAVMRNDVGEPVIVGNLWGPRVYVAWDPGGDGRSKIAGGFGRFNDTGRLATAAFTSQSGYGTKLFLGEAFLDSGVGVLNGAESVYSVTPRESGRTAHDTLRMPRADEVMLKVERQIGEEWSVGTTVSTKFTRTLYEHDETNLIYDEDGSEVVGSRTGNSDLASYRLRTPVVATRDYVRADFRVDKVSARRWFARGTASVTRSWGSSPSSLSGAFANDPQSRFAYGPLAGDVLFSVRGLGSWQLPTDPAKQTIGVVLGYAAGRPMERLYGGGLQGAMRIRDRGAYTRGNGVAELSVKFTQDVPLRKGHLELDVEALNLLSGHAPVAWSSNSLQTEDRLVTLARQDPLRLQLGAKYKF